MSHGQCKENSLFYRPERGTKRWKTPICKTAKSIQHSTSSGPVTKPSVAIYRHAERLTMSLHNRAVTAAKVDVARGSRLNCSAVPKPHKRRLEDGCR